MKIASFNVENLFDRPKIFNEPKEESNKINDIVTKLNNLLELDIYTAADKARILELLTDLDLKDKDESEFVLLRQNRGKLISRHNDGSVEIVANGRQDWIGWIELKTAPVNATAITNTAQVIRDVNADIFVAIEAENRIALKQYSDIILKSVGGSPYEEVMIIDGNDTRGIDVGIMTKNGFRIGIMQSHVHDKNATTGESIFSRDCPEYLIHTPTNEEIWILPNHLKSKFGGNNASSKKKRLSQSTRVKEIYERLTAEGKDKIVILGDMNDTPDSNELSPLLQHTDLQDVSKHPNFDAPGINGFKGKGTFGSGTDANKIDYILLSPALFARITACGLFRKGAWPGVRPKKWDVYPELVEEIHAASDHHLIWVELQ
ncbi:endonuclease/exonuclease/phosphatase family protein [Emticicia fontis]